jgi:glutathione S-transferase
MIALYGSGPLFGLPDPSPFVIKAEMLFKLAKIPFSRGKMNFSKAPKGKIPYIGDDGVLIGDSHFIARHLEARHGADFSGGYDSYSRAVGWSASRMMEEHLYFLMVCERWLDDDNFHNGPRLFFNAAPAPLRPFIRTLIRRKVRSKVHEQGLSRHSPAERGELAAADAQAIADIMGNNPYLLGERISEADACVFPFLWSTACKTFNGPVGDAVRANKPCMDYVGRLSRQFFPDYANG